MLTMTTAAHIAGYGQVEGVGDSGGWIPLRWNGSHCYMVENKTQLHRISKYEGSGTITGELNLYL